MTVQKIGKTLGFFAGLFLILYVLTLFQTSQTRKNVYDSTAVRLKIDRIRERQNEPLDVLFLGDSICYSSFSPEYILDKHQVYSYVAGTSAQRLCDSYAILQGCFAVRSPKVVVIEANCLYRKMDSPIAKDDVMMEYLHEKSDLVAMHSAWKDVVDRVFQVKKREEDKNPDGFVKRETINPYCGGEYMIADSKREEIPSQNLTYLNQMKQLCDEHNVRFVIVSVPSPLNWNYARHNQVNDWATENKVAYVDMNLIHSIQIDWNKDTKDGGDHLNYAGAMKVSSYMGQYLDDCIHGESYGSRVSEGR